MLPFSGSLEKRITNAIEVSSMMTIYRSIATIAPIDSTDSAALVITRIRYTAARQQIAETMFFRLRSLSKAQNRKPKSGIMNKNRLTTQSLTTYSGSCTLDLNSVSTR